MNHCWDSYSRERESTPWAVTVLVLSAVHSAVGSNWCSRSASLAEISAACGSDEQRTLISIVMGRWLAGTSTPATAAGRDENNLRVMAKVYA